jgi:hypothetical protein
MAAVSEVVYRITSRRTYDYGATNSDGDSDSDNIRSSELSNENRSPQLLCRLALPERRKRQTSELKQEGGSSFILLMSISSTDAPLTRDAAGSFRRDLTN